MYLAMAIDNINESQLNWLVRVRGCVVVGGDFVGGRVCGADETLGLTRPWG